MASKLCLHFHSNTATGRKESLQTGWELSEAAADNVTISRLRVTDEQQRKEPVTPPPWTDLITTFSRWKGYSMIPVVGTLTLSTSCWLGR